MDYDDAAGRRFFCQEQPRHGITRGDMRIMTTDEPLMTFKSHTDGKNADVAIYSDRIEWAKEGGVSLTRVTTGLLTSGVSLLKTGVRKGGGSEMIPVRSMSSVTMEKDGLRFHKVVVISSGNTVEFRTGKDEAVAAKALLTDLMIGRHSSQQQTPAPTAPVAPPPAVAPAAATNVADELAKLAALRDSGVLSDAEFAAAKARLLG